MEIRKQYEASFEPHALITPTWDVQLAKCISWGCSPPLMAATGIILSAAYIGTPAAWGWAVFYIGLAVSIPAGYVWWLVHQGQVTDFDLRRREQRIWPFLATLISVLLAWLGLYLGQAPNLMVALAGAGWFNIALLLAITLYWKISIHCTVMGGLIVFTYALFGSAAAPLALMLPLVIWSRLRLRRHTLSQTIAGALLGGGVMVMTFHLTL
jgi:membrane-associated phospholipid phosphatase